MICKKKSWLIKTDNVKIPIYRTESNFLALDQWDSRNIFDISIFQYHLILSYLISSLQGTSCYSIHSNIQRYVFRLIKISTHLVLLQDILGAMYFMLSRDQYGYMFLVSFCLLIYISFLVTYYKLGMIVNELIVLGNQFLRSKNKRILIKTEIFCVIIYFLFFILAFGIELMNRTIDIIHRYYHSYYVSLCRLLKPTYHQHF